MTSKFVADYLYEEIVNKTGKSPFAIMLAIENRFGFEISYDMAWRAKQKALEKRFGTYEDSYHNLPSLLELVQARNPGTVIGTHDFVNAEGKRVLQRAFWSLGCMIEAFRHCRPILCVDGTFLTGKYKGQILTAIGVDGENQVVPIAFALVERENRESWLWFLRWVKQVVIMNRPNVCILHDRHAGLLSAVKTLQTDANDEAFWPDLHSRWCMRHLGANFFSQFKSKRLMNMFKKLCKQNRRDKFNRLWDQLEKLTTRQMKELAKIPSTGRDEPVGLEPLPNEPQRVTRQRRRGRRVKSFSEWIKNEPIENWALIEDKDGSRYGIMTTNGAEVYNWVIKGSRCLPLVGLLEAIVRGTQTYLQDRYAKALINVANPQLIYTTYITEYMVNKSLKAQRHRIVRTGNRELVFEVLLQGRSGLGVGRSEVTMECTLWPDARQCQCTCNKPALHNLPCSHVFAACAKANIDTHHFVSPYYHKEVVEATWRGEVLGWRAISDFTKPPEGDRIWIPDPEAKVVTKGRRKEKRIRNDMDVAQSKGGKKECIVCGGNHKRQDCNMYPEERRPDGTVVRHVPMRKPRRNEGGPSRGT